MIPTWWPGIRFLLPPWRTAMSTIPPPMGRFIVSGTPTPNSKGPVGAALSREYIAHECAPTENSNIFG